MNDSRNKNLTFNHRITLQYEEQVKDDFGGINTVLKDIKQVWGKISAINISQNFSKMKQECEITHNIEIRYDEKAKKCKKILFGSRSFLVIGFFCQDDKNEFLTFRVKEIL